MLLTEAQRARAAANKREALARLSRRRQQATFFVSSGDDIIQQVMRMAGDSASMNLALTSREIFQRIRPLHPLVFAVEIEVAAQRAEYEQEMQANACDARREAELEAWAVQLEIGKAEKFERDWKAAEAELELWGYRYDRDKCFRCSQIGHWARDCPLINGARTYCIPCPSMCPSHRGRRQWQRTIAWLLDGP